ncbi:hypothetical protein SFUMM280S_10519 [Streptomyces fumanus]
MRKNSGMVSASTGTIWATRNMISRVVRKRNRKRVTAVAARNAMSAEAITTVPATTRLLRKYRPNSCCPKTRRNASKEGASVHGRGASDSISPAGLKALSTIQYRGNATTAATSSADASAANLHGRLTVPPPGGAAAADSRG